MHDRISRALVNVMPRAVAGTASRVMSSVQSLDPADAVAGTAAAFLLIAEAYEVTPRRALEVAARALKDAENSEWGDVTVGAIRDLLDEELRA